MKIKIIFMLVLCVSLSIVVLGISIGGELGGVVINMSGVSNLSSIENGMTIPTINIGLNVNFQFPIIFR